MDKGAKVFILQMIQRELFALEDKMAELEAIVDQLTEEDEEMNIFERAMAKEFDLTEEENDDIVDLFTVGIQGDRVMIGVDPYVSEYINLDKVFGADGHQAIGSLAFRIVEAIHNELEKRGEI